MTQLTSFRVCPSCGSRRSVDEITCEDLRDGAPCGWLLTDVAISSVEELPIVDPPTLTPGLQCPNGHAVSPGDLMCGECGADLVDGGAPPQAEVFAGWEITSTITTSGNARRRHHARRSEDGKVGFLTIYAPGAQPDGDVYRALRDRIPREHIAELLESGEVDGRAYDVTELIGGGTLAELATDRSDMPALRRVVEELTDALAIFQESGLRHRSLHPDKILVRSIDPLDLVITGFESARLSEADLETESLIDFSRFTAPEAMLGGVASASDWWSVGMVLLGLATAGACFEGASDQVFLIHVQAHGAPIPSGLDPRLELLLRGLLTIDRTKRWQLKEVRAWLDGESPSVATHLPAGGGAQTGPAIQLGNVEIRDPRIFATTAATAAHWQQACGFLTHGQLALWVEQLKLPGSTVAAIRQLGRRTDPSVGLRLGLSLQHLFPAMPLIHEEQLVTPAWLLSHPELGYELITSFIPDALAQLGLASDGFLIRLAARLKAVRSRASALEIELDEDRLRGIALIASTPKLIAIWNTHRQALPDANHPALAAIIERRNPTDEDLVILLSAALGQFRSTADILEAIKKAAKQNSLPDPDEALAMEFLALPRKQLYASVDERITGFARCGHQKLDAWADQFRLDHRLPLPEVVLLLAYPAEAWAKPKHQEYVSSVVGFFEKRVSASTQRGPLVRMTIGKTTPRIDMTELGSDPAKALTLLTSLLQRTGKRSKIDPLVFADDLGPEKRCRVLLNKKEQYLRDTGVNGTYIGFPFLVRKPVREQTSPRLAPILLWPVTLTGFVGTRGDYTLAFDESRGEVRLNPAFEGLLGLDGAAKWKEVARDLMSNSSLTIADVVGAFASLAEPQGTELEALPAPSSLGGEETDQILCSAVLFHVEFIGQALVEDLRHLKQRPVDQSALERMLRIDPEADASTPEPQATLFSSSTDSGSRFLVRDSDPSQEEAIAKAGESEGLLIQGPPGTGKSQTIVNLVADSIGHGRTVLIVCQKLPALEVVRKRLEAEQLGDRVVMITNVTKDRMPVLRDIRAQLDRLDQRDETEVSRRARTAESLASQIDKAEAEIDSYYHAGHQRDPRNDRTHREILGELIDVEMALPKPPLDAVNLRAIYRDLSATDALDLAEACSSVAAEWRDASYEASPLHATQAFHHDSATITEFQDAFQRFSDAESGRDAIPQPRDRVEGLICPPGLDAWLERHREDLTGWADATVQAAAPCLDAFEPSGAGTEYAETLVRVNALVDDEIPPIVVSPECRDLVGSFTAEQMESIAASCQEHVAAWVSAAYEGSPLDDVDDSAAAPENFDTFRQGIERLAHAEAARHSTLTATHSRVRVDAPDLLDHWLGTCAEPLEGLAAAVAPAARDLVSPEMRDRSCTRYAEALERIVEHGTASRTWSITLPPLAEVLLECDDQRVERIVNETALVADLWLSQPFDKTLVEGIARFPATDFDCRRLELAIQRFVQSERERTASLAGKSHDITVAEPAQTREWLKEIDRLLPDTDQGVCEDIARWLSLYLNRSSPSKSPGEISAELEALCLEHQRLEVPQGQGVLAETVAALDDANLETLLERAAGAVRSLDRKSWLFGRLSRLRSSLWLFTGGLPAGADGIRRMSDALRREADRRRLIQAAQAKCVALSVPLPASDWPSVRKHLKDVAERFDFGLRLSKVIARCPCSIDKRGLLSGESHEAIIETVETIRSTLAAHDAEAASLSSLDAIRADMKPTWIDWQRQTIQAAVPSETHQSYLQTLLEALPLLSPAATLSQTLSGCDDATRYVLAALTPARPVIESYSPSERAEDIRELVWRHALVGRKQRLEKDTPALRSLPSIRREDATSSAALLRKVATAAEIVESCPLRSVLLSAVQSGSATSIQNALKSFRGGLAVARARGSSQEALAEVSRFLTPAAHERFGGAIESDAATGGRVDGIFQAVPTLPAYVRFRKLAASFPPDVRQAFQLLSSTRAAVLAVPEADRGEAVSRGIRLAHLRNRLAAFEAQRPELMKLKGSGLGRARGALEALEAARLFSSVVATCPLARPLIAAIQAGSARGIEVVLLDFHARVERGRALAESMGQLDGLAEWMTPEWIVDRRKTIEAGGSNAAAIKSIRDSLSTLPAFQLFRTRAAGLGAIHFKAFEILARSRAGLMQLAKTCDGDIGQAVRLVMQRESLQAWKQKAEAANPALTTDNKAIAAKVVRLGSLDADLRKMNRERLGADIPIDDVSGIDDWEDITRLQGPRALRLRQFFDQGRAHGLLMLRPVWMMTPDVASQLLPLEKALFDLVVFDEASQMPVEYAIPSLYRATSAVVSGDEKQMPPSSFFSSRVGVDEPEWSDDDQPDDAASDQEREIVEQTWNRREVKDCPDLLHLGMAVLPKATLQIHYRSQYRELIAFSNAAFYRNELGVPVRHPEETVKEKKPIEYRAVRGIYGKQCNPKEAAAVVDVIADLWATHGSDGPSAGIVTFNLKQADLIEELLEERAEKDEAFRDVYAAERERKDGGEDMSFFVKNVENVQGDERDLIIFSTTFGKTSAGTFRRNFGVLGQSGGERRLNVAITRARSKIIVVGSMPIDEISDMIRTRRKPEVPRDYLQGFLQYASLVSAGQLQEAAALVDRLATTKQAAAETSQTHDGFRKSVAAFIKGLGHDPVPTGNDPVLGVDFSIRNRSTGLFSVAVQCDPPRHRLLTRARGREIWRPAVLSRTYRHIHRISAYAWYQDPEGERERLRREIAKHADAKGGKA